ncbi:uncharacterized protein LOC143264619 isoform X2 [Megachile rotundata]|uniref:uncharacterized protein LOC143264619 isoform X2 n=1 Tax=Megachile rotundata TaxID=143995 RepID=UPI003FD0CADB
MERVTSVVCQGKFNVPLDPLSSPSHVIARRYRGSVGRLRAGECVSRRDARRHRHRRDYRDLGQLAITGAPSSRRDFLRRSGQWHRSTYSPRDRATSPTRREKGRNTERLFTVKQRRTTGRVILTVSTLNT